MAHHCVGFHVVETQIIGKMSYKAFTFSEILAFIFQPVVMRLSLLRETPPPPLGHWEGFDLY